MRFEKIYAYYIIYLSFSLLSRVKFCEKLNDKAKIKNGEIYRNHCWRELGLGMIANDPNVNMAERMAFSRHNNASSHIAYIRAGHNSDFSFQKAVSGAPMPKKKEILKKQSLAKKIAKKETKTKNLKVAPPMLKRAPPTIRKTNPQKKPKAMKAPPKRPASVTPLRRSGRVQKDKKTDE